MLRTQSNNSTGTDKAIVYNDPDDSLIPDKVLRELMRMMVLIRRFEEKIIDVYADQDMKSPVHLCIGEEAVAAGVCVNLKKDDYVFTTHRSHGHCLAKGVPPKELYAEFYGRVTGCSRGKGGSMHPAAPEYGILGTSAIVGGGMPLAVGTALASKMRNNGRVAVTFFGDGAVDEGTFHESLNFASLKKLPVVFVCENNFYATNSHISARQPHSDIYKRAEGYNIPGFELNGNDVVSICAAAKKAVDRAQNGAGPTLLECKTYRWKGHVGPDCDYERGCRPKEELATWMDRCPIEIFKKSLLEKEAITENWYENLLREMDKSLDNDLKFGKESPFPKEKELLEHVYFERST